ncbi:Y-family DNA polymerase [Nitrosomonas sp. Nm34]|uniref:Y-family DNA polymerase n=1 Tax=Nitrosomonas sp. Nm34 TaxID=1881055 RepID=UPI0008F1A135|nr:Y-family DNA polymerase [Nitrosomonas sp. Nm34]SFI80918.1 DNA polymerase V [Nitrosomonas sp. Nm34]
MGSGSGDGSTFYRIIMSTGIIPVSRPLFALVDVNNFYVSCERAFNPNLINRPVVVLSNNDGCAVARSNEVKALGVKMGTPWFQLKDLAKQHGIVALSSNYTLYGDMSNRVMSILRDFSPHVEVYSIDECFLGLQGLQSLWPIPTGIGHKIRHRIRQWTTLPVCVGIGATKTLAKLANHIAKKQPAFHGVCDFSTMSYEQYEALLSTIDAGEVWGVGRQLNLHLNAAGIKTVQALRDTPPAWLRANFGVVIERLGYELRGISCLALEEVLAPKKQIISSRSFGQLIDHLTELSESVASHTSSAAEKLRRQNSVCNAIQVFIRTNPFREQEKQYSNCMTVPLPNASSDTRLLVRAALFGLKRIYRPGYAYKKAGVILTGIDSAAVHQESLFTLHGADDRSARLMKVLDQLNQRYGRETVSVFSVGSNKSWSMQRESMSPCYTTKWQDVPIAYAH